MGRLHHYRAKLTWTGAAEGPTKTYAGYSREHLFEAPGKPPVRGSADPAFRGDAMLHNPEDLLVMSLSACHMLTYLALATRAKIEVVGYEDEASGTMEEQGGGGRFVEVILRPTVTVAKGTDVTLALGLHEKAHADCFIAASVSFPVRHEARIVTARPESA